MRDGDRTDDLGLCCNYPCRRSYSISSNFLEIYGLRDLSDLFCFSIAGIWDFRDVVAVHTYLLITGGRGDQIKNSNFPLEVPHPLLGRILRRSAFLLEPMLALTLFVSVKVAHSSLGAHLIGLPRLTRGVWTGCAGTGCERHSFLGSTRRPATPQAESSTAFRPFGCRPPSGQAFPVAFAAHPAVRGDAVSERKEE